jgi:Tfp pilus assembly protein PilV
MQEQLVIKKQFGFSVVEVLIAGAVLTVFMAGIVSALVAFGKNINTSGNKQRAVMLSEEALEASRNIRDASFSNLIDGTYGLATTTNQWNFSGSSDQTGIFTRQTAISTVNSNQKQITSTVSWSEGSGLNRSVSLSEYLTSWFSSSIKGGLLVYGNGGTTLDSIFFRVLDSTGNWSVPSQTADIDAGTSNRALRSVRVYASATRNEKILISRHYNGTTQYIYAQVYNGITWGNVQLLSSWNAGTFLDVQNFDGTYLANGNFMAVFSDNTIIPKMRTWNGTVWSSQSSLTTLSAGAIPNFIVTKTRPGTNEVMSAFFNQNLNTSSQYYNGTSWSAVTSHAATAPVNTTRFVDFAWSPNNSLKGGLVYSTGASDRAMHIKIWTANGLGSGSWSGVANTVNQGVGSTRLGAIAIAGRPGVDEFIACSKNSTLQIICYKSNFTPTWTNPTNQSLTATTAAGIQRPFHIGFESISGDPAIGVYSDATTIPKLKKYNASSSTWDASATSLNSLSSSLVSVKIIPAPTTNDIMVLLGDASLDLYSTIWNGTNNAIYPLSLGNTLVESNLDSNTVGRAESFFTTATASGTINSLTVYLDSTSASTNLVVGLYADSGGHPGTLLSQASSSSLINGAWNTITIPPIFVVSGTNYWISILGTAGGVPRFRDRSGGPCNSETSSSTTLSALPSTWTTGTIFTTCPLSAFGASNGFSFTPQGISGSVSTDYWYDFAWDVY